MKYKKYINGAIVMGAVYIVASSNCIPYATIKVSGSFLGTNQDLLVCDIISEKIIKNEVNQELAIYDKETLDNALVSKIAQTYSLDAATLYTLDRIYKKEKNKINQQSYLAYLNTIQSNQIPKEIEQLKSKYFLFIPGLAYKEDTTTGADFARQRRLLTDLGIENKLIETGEYALSEKNAQLIANEIKEASKTHDDIVLVSASKGGLETAISIGQTMTAEELKSVSAWVSVGGILNGSPIADQYLKAPKCWFAVFMLWIKGYNIDVVRDISHSRRSKDFANYVFPNHIKIIHFVGVPLTSQVHKRIRGRYCSMQKIFGPNDGLTTIPDEITEQGIVISELGLDHYFKDENIDKKTLALACLVIKTIKNERT
jgi:hypothetical protein